MARRTRKPKQRRNAGGHLSGFESKVAAVLDERQETYEYETMKLKYVLPSPERTYKPDFIIGTGFQYTPNVRMPYIIEAKGYFPYEAQVKMKAVKKANPDLDIRFVFMYPYRLLPRRKITHADWAEAEGFPWTDLEGLATGTWIFPDNA